MSARRVRGLRLTHEFVGLSRNASCARGRWPHVDRDMISTGDGRGDRLRDLDASLRAGIARGLGYLTAEDEKLDGRFVTLHGRRHLNFGSCSYVGLETDPR